MDMTRPLLLILLAHSAAASSLADITRVERTLTFPGWRRLARETRHDYIKNGYSSGLETMELKQRLHDGDRSHPRVVGLDKTKTDLSYPGWRSDAAQAEMASHPMCWSLPYHLESTVAKMKRKQEYHEACPPNVLTAVCLSGASQVGHCLHLSGERFGYGWPCTFLALPLALPLNLPFSALTALPFATFLCSSNSLPFSALPLAACSLGSGTFVLRPLVLLM